MRQVDTCWTLCVSGQIAPHFVGSEAEDRSYQANQRFNDFVDDRLRGAAGDARRCEGVHAVLEHVEVDGAEVDDAELIDSMVDTVELEVSVPAAFTVRSADLLDQLTRASKHVLVEREQVFIRHRMFGRVEAVQVAEQEAEGVAQLAVVVRNALHEVFAGSNVFAEVHGCNPEADDFRAHTVGDIDRINAIAKRLRHGATLLVERPAGSSDHGVRSFVVCAYGY